MDVNAPRLKFAALVGIAAGAALWFRVAPIEPFLEVAVHRTARAENYDIYSIEIEARGGETIDEVKLEAVSGPVHIVGDEPFLLGLKSGWKVYFKVRLDDGRTTKGTIRVVQFGRVSRTYDDITLGDGP